MEMEQVKIEFTFKTTVWFKLINAKRPILSMIVLYLLPYGKFKCNDNKGWTYMFFKWK